MRVGAGVRVEPLGVGVLDGDGVTAGVRVGCVSVSDCG